MGPSGGGVNGLVARFQGARRDRALAVLEGFHAVKHGARFGADVELLVARDRDRALRLAESLAPDVRPVFEKVETVPAEVFRKLAPHPPGTGVLAIARRRAWSLEDALVPSGDGLAVLVEHSSDLGNVGAVIRNAAGLGARGVVLVGEHDPWHPDAVRGAAGLQYAVPVIGVPRLADLSLSERGAPVVGLDPEGTPLRPGTIPPGAILAFGAERQGLSAELRALVQMNVALPMRPGVSSLNLASTVGIVLYASTLQAGM